MATFKVGDKVRVSANCPSNLAGKTGVVAEIFTPPRFKMPWASERPGWSPCSLSRGIHPRETAYILTFDDPQIRMDSYVTGPFGFPSYWLEPAVDPKADQFIENIKKLKPYEEPKVDTPSIYVVVKSARTL